jgi:photosystem II stability/assembly factor-like uncharacterized protein
VIFKSVDGDKWQRLDGVIPNGKYLKLISIFFYKSIGWVIGEGKAAKTIDGGKNWTEMNLNNYSKLKQIKFSNPNIGWIVGENGLLLKTTDGGNNWLKVIHLPKVNEINSILTFPDKPESIIIVGSKGLFAISEDEGITWKTSKVFGQKEINSIECSDNMNFVIAGKNGLLMNTKDGGKQWNSIKLPEKASKTDFISAIILENGSYFVSSGNGNLYYTNNNGESWYNPDIAEISSRSTFYGNNKLISVGKNGNYFVIDDVNKFESVYLVFSAYKLCIEKCNKDDLECIKICNEMWLEALKLVEDKK